MGMYTELVCAFELPEDTDPCVIETLQIMTGEIEMDEHVLPDHELFQTDRWYFMLRCDSYYFPGTTHSEIKHDEIAKDYYVTIRCNLKNYCGEIEKFIDWITPYIYRGAPENDKGKMFIGYKRYEEDAEPTLIYI